ncbi:GDSL-type esterase/lipase family protein [Actinacidiphila sp. DG2A-62]|uniref:GDSL-type esterase/lipase family protein n=1 Tax=Actinacidiphila sp. DG2A-62 TaxID=3108821 RepID=UPI002DB7122F|nr:GDSL-type esterase/lipase family protein [Actinacidiphila sp. DG2A-62]MEC3993739.1 GDSL-type esterase/lipase family protein [Actinacidiphila sp. DG2A-62]
MRTHETRGAMGWRPTWTQAMTDFRGEDDEPPFDDVTVRMTVPASIGGSRVRVELSNRFADGPVRIGRCAVGVGGRFAEVFFDGKPSTDIPARESRWSDPADLAVGHGHQVLVDVYLPDPTPYATANRFTFDRSRPGDFAGSPEFPLEGSAPTRVSASREIPMTATEFAPAPDGTGWSLPAGGPFLRTVEVAGAPAKAVVVCLGSSSTVMGWPQYTAALLPADAQIAVLDRGIAGNRMRLDAPRRTPSWGRAGLSRFDEDVLETHGVTHVVIAYNSNDWGLPGRITPLDEMPTVAQLIDGYREFVERAREGGLTVILATVTPLGPEVADEPGREEFRLAVNAWIRTCGHAYVDFDAAIRSPADPSRLADAYAAPDRTHPNVDGSKRLAQAMAEVLTRLPL